MKNFGKITMTAAVAAMTIAAPAQAAAEVLCKPTVGATSMAGVVNAGEVAVPMDRETWVRMAPASDYNMSQNGGCTLKVGEMVVIDHHTGRVLRVLSCGNVVVNEIYIRQQPQPVNASAKACHPRFGCDGRDFAYAATGHLNSQSDAAGKRAVIGSWGTALIKGATTMGAAALLRPNQTTNEGGQGGNATATATGGEGGSVGDVNVGVTQPPVVNPDGGPVNPGIIDNGVTVPNGGPANPGIITAPPIMNPSPINDGVSGPVGPGIIMSGD